MNFLKKILGLKRKKEEFKTLANKPIVFGNTFRKICFDLNIGQENYTPEQYTYFTLEEFNILKDKKIVFDGTKGGLVLGNLHSEGGIHLISFINQNRIKYIGEMEGWEYLSSPYNGIDIDNFENFKHINEKTLNTNRFANKEFKIPKDCNTIDLRGVKIPFLLINERNHAIINRFATKKHIIELIKIDKINYS